MSQTPAVSRRRWLRSTTTTLVGAAALQSLGGVFTQSAARATEGSPANRVRVGVMGVNGRGTHLMGVFANQTDCEIAFICDVDRNAIDKAQAAHDKQYQRKPAGVVDIRKALEDKTVDALVVATPNHWHAPATILGCVAGKHVYVEKPCSHNPAEGELQVAAARKFNRVVQMGNQRRSWPGIIDAIAKIREGFIGPVHYAKCWYASKRGSIGVGKPAMVPDWLDYSLWQGPAPERPYVDNLVHYNWHWRWHWGNGELGNNGVHSLDLARWALGVDYPVSVASTGGRNRFEDDQETPDTHTVAFHFQGRKSITWEGLSWSNFGFDKTGSGVIVYGEAGVMTILNSGWVVYDLDGKETARLDGVADDGIHVRDFLDCIRAGGAKRPNSDIEEGHKSTLLCHLGNIAYRVGGAIKTDPANGHVLENEAGQALWGREYRPGWEPKLS